MNRIFGLTLVLVVTSLLAATSQARTTTNSPRSGALHVTKECSAYTGLAWSYCTITGSNLNAIKAGSTVVYASAAGPTSVDSDLVIYAGHDTVAVGHVTLDFTTYTGHITISGGTGQLAGFRARAVVSLDRTTGLWHWDGTYRFGADDDAQSRG
jgi:hypothetical protein